MISETAVSQDQVRARALALFAEHDLLASGWKFAFDRAQKRLGLCTYTTRTISLGAAYAASATMDAIEQTLLHEIAHALVGHSVGHGPVWKRQAKAIGHSGDRTGKNPAHEAQDAKDIAFAQSVTASRASIVSGPFQVGELVTTRDRKLSGLVFNVARTRLRMVNDADGKPWTVPMSMLIRANGFGGHTPTPTVQTSLPKTGRRAPAAGNRFTIYSTSETITIHKPGSKYHGITGRVQSIGSKNYKVRLSNGVLLTTPPAFVRNAQEAQEAQEAL
jgi:hypothetical protein